MRQPYESNPKCHYKDQIPLEKRERRLLFFWKIVFTIPIATLSLGAFLLLISLYASDGFANLEWDMLLFLILPILFGIALYNLFKKERYKEIFESEVKDHFGIFFIHWIYFNDKIGKVSPLPFSYKVNQVKNGQRYRIHKLKGRSVLLKMDKIS